ncbi:MAG TPA: hypothetical protein VMU92_03830 [Acidobacteriaceae bacterium]|nr:hypothetical protein [Acidobacteriaceae bacterium]
MIKRNKILSATLMTALMTALLPLARPVYGQDANSGPIHMAALLVTVQKTVDAKKAKPGDEFTLKTVSPATLNNGTAIPTGSILEGHVDSATPSKHHSDSTLAVTIDKLKLKGGKEIAVKAIIVRVYSLLPVMGEGNASANQQFGSRRLQGGAAGMPDPNQESGSSSKGGNSGQHLVRGLSLTSSVTGSNSGTLTQKRRNVHLSNENELEVAVAVIPAGVILEQK